MLLGNTIRTYNDIIIITFLVSFHCRNNERFSTYNKNSDGTTKIGRRYVYFVVNKETFSRRRVQKLRKFFVTHLYVYIYIYIQS